MNRIYTYILLSETFLETYISIQQKKQTKIHQTKQNRKEVITMSTKEIISKIEALTEWEAIIEEAKAEAEALRDSIKEEMLKQNTEELEAGTYIVRWTSVLSQRFDSTAFKKSHGDMYQEFTKQVSSRRFSIC